MRLWTDLKNTFRKPTPLEIATVELVEAELAKLEAETGREFADSQVQYNAARIARLKKFVAAATKEEAK
jgi:hypothetical protein